MVLPDGTHGPEPKTSGVGRSTLFLLAAGGLLLGFLLLGSLSARGPEAVASSTSTSTTTTTEPIEPPLDLDDFSVSQISRGEPFAWERSLAVDDGYPVALFEHEGWIYLFASDSSFERSEGGLWGWRSVDGADWEPMGEVITEPHLISQVASTGEGLVAVGRDQTNREPTIGRSVDGIDWIFEELPVEDLEPFTSVYPTAAASTDTLLVVAAQITFDIYDTLQERISQSHDFDPGRYGWDVQVVGDVVEVAFYGPLGFPLDVIAAEELGLSPEEIKALVAGYQSGNWASLVWSKSGDGGWVQSEMLDSFSVESLSVTPEDNVVAFGYGSTSASTWTTRDGEHWEPTDSRGPYRVHSWDERLIGPSDSGRASVLVSEKDGSWNDIGPGQLFPYELSWHIEGIGAGAGGIATIVRGWDQSASFEPAESFEPVTLTSNGTTLALDFYAGSYTLETADGSTQHRWSMTGITPKGVVPDLDRGVISFHDQETGDFLASFPIDEIFEAQNEYWSRYSGSESIDRYVAFAFSGDGADWSIQDAGAALGDIWVSHLEVTETRVIAAGIVDTQFYDPTAPPSFAVWSAAIP